MDLFYRFERGGNMASAYEGIQEANKIFMERVAQGDAAALSTCYTEKCQFLVDNIETAEGRRAVQGVRLI